MGFTHNDREGKDNMNTETQSTNTDNVIAEQRVTMASERLLNANLIPGVPRRHHERLLAGCARYVQADKSDPFAGRRMAAHLRSGIAIAYEQETRTPYSYDADKALETRICQKTDGMTEEYKVEVYTNRKRTS